MASGSSLAVSKQSPCRTRSHPSAPRASVYLRLCGWWLYFPTSRAKHFHLERSFIKDSQEIRQHFATGPHINTWCCPMCSWQVMYFCIFILDLQHMCLSAVLSCLPLQSCPQLEAGYLAVKLQTDPYWPYILRIVRLQQSDHTFTYPLCSVSELPSFGIMALHRNVMKDNNILCELRADTYCDVSEDCETEILDTDSDVPTTSLHKQLAILSLTFY